MCLNSAVTLFFPYDGCMPGSFVLHLVKGTEFLEVFPKSVKGSLMAAWLRIHSHQLNKRANNVKGWSFSLSLICS